MILSLQRKLPSVYGNDSLFEYIVQLAEESRRHPDVSLGASPRAALNLLRCAARGRCWRAGTSSRTKTCRRSRFRVLGHRLILRPEAEIEGKHVADVVRDILHAVPVLETV